jgi:hypothetical protein
MQRLEFNYIDILHKTNQALLIVTAKGKQGWVPRSQVKLSYDESTIWIPLWLARKKGLTTC